VQQENNLTILDACQEATSARNVLYRDVSAKPMGLNLILLTIVVVSCAIVILQTRQDAITNSPRWLHIAIAVLFLTGILLLLIPAQAGYWISVVWVFLVIIPSLGFQLSDYYFYRGKYLAARQLKGWLTWLHPLHDWPWQYALYTAYAERKAGDNQAALAVLQQALTAAEPPPEQEVLLFYMSNDWQGLVAWWESYPQLEQLVERPDVIRYYLQALGEIGQLNELVNQFHRYHANLESVPLLAQHSYLYLFAFCGRVEATIHLLATTLAERITPDMRMCWIATAHSAAGNKEMSRALLRPLLRTTKETLVKAYVEMRLGKEVVTAETRLEADEKANLQKIEDAWFARERQLSLWH